MSGTSSISNGQVIAGKCWEMKGKEGLGLSLDPFQTDSQKSL